MDKKIKEYFLKYVGGYKSAVLLGFASAIVGLLIHLHGYSESWAWEIAKAIITIDGILLGFIILGATLFFSERGYSTSGMAEVFEKHFEDFWKRLRVVDVSNSEKTTKQFISCVESAVAEIVVVPSSVSTCMICLTLSIAFALSLFGVSDTTANNTTLTLVFSVGIFGSIMFLMIGLYLTYRFIREFVRVAARIEMTEAFEKSLEIFKKKIGDMTTEKKEKNKTI